MEKESIFKKPLVCFFDSGIGGLNLMRSCAEKIRWADFVYFADNYNVPYGDLSDDKIISLVDEKFARMLDLGCSVAVIACNTATAVCAEFLRKKYPFKIVGIQPAIRQAAKEGGRIAVFATPATVKSASFCALMEKYSTNDTKIYALPMLAEEIENHILDIGNLDLDRLLPTIDADGIVLGCTHYIFIKNEIQKKYLCRIYDGILGTTDHICAILGNVDHQGDYEQKITFFGGNFAKNEKIYQIMVNN